MKFDTLSQIENRFQTENAAFLKSFTLPVPQEDLLLRATTYTPNRSDYYYKSEYPKQRIVLHFTAGNLRSDVMSLTQQSRHVSVPFVIARDGGIYQLFPSKCWSGHLGEGVGNKKGTGNPQDKATNGIELSNYGHLVPKNGNMETIYSRLKDPRTGSIGPVDNYCSVNDLDAYSVVEEPFRGQNVYPTYTPEQLDSLIILLRFLTSRYNIPRAFLPTDVRYKAYEGVVSFKGIVSHVNYRSSGKWDIGPAFDWDTLIAGVQAPTYETIQSGSRGLEMNIATEEEIDAQFPQTRALVEEEEEATDNEGYNPFDFE